MIKWLFFLLLVLNLGLFIWLYPQQNDPARSMVMNHPVGDLRLVGEPIPKASVAELSVGLSAEPKTADRVAESAPFTQDEAANESAGNAPAERNPAPSQKKQCRSLGVFEKRSEAELISVQLRALGLSPQISSESVNNQAGFWVLIPARANRAEAVATAKNLEQAGVTDIWRFTSGELAHAISLGLFTDLERARARSEQIAALGFAPEVRPRYRQQTRYWVSYEFTGASPLSEGKWQDLVRIQPQMESNSVPCE